MFKTVPLKITENVLAENVLWKDNYVEVQIII